MKLIRWDTARDGSVSEAALRARSAPRGCAVERREYPPGTHIPSHSHDIDHFAAVVSGRLHMVMEGEAITLEPGDRLVISRDELHSTTVVGAVPAVVLEGFC